MCEEVTADAMQSIAVYANERLGRQSVVNWGAQVERAHSLARHRARARTHRDALCAHAYNFPRNCPGRGDFEHYDPRLVKASWIGRIGSKVVNFENLMNQ